VPAAPASASAKGPVGWDVYRRLDLLPLLREEERTRQFSSYDRTGLNDDGSNGTYSCRRRVADGCLIAERDGPGQLESIWFTRDLGDLAGTGRLRVRVDGREVVDAPLTDVLRGRLGGPFAFPFVADSDRSSGGGYVKVPMPFRRSMRVTTQRNPGYYHVTYRAFGDRRGVPRFHPRRPADGVLATLRAGGTADPKPRSRRLTRVRRTVRVPAGGRKVLATLRGAGLVTALRLRLRGPASEELLRRSRLQISFDGGRTVHAPLGEFFGSGLGPARVRALMFAMGPEPDDWLSSWWPMPYAESVSIAVTNPTRAASRADVVLAVAPSRSWARLLRSGEAGYFRATARGPAPTRRGRDWKFLEERGRGTFVGVTQTMRGAKADYLEGDERVYVDGSARPQLHGTGTEDFYEGGWYFTRSFISAPFTLPLNGFPKEADGSSGCPMPTCKTAYRLMLGDAVPFRSSIRFGIEHGPSNDVDAVYSSTAYWYREGPS